MIKIGEALNDKELNPPIKSLFGGIQMLQTVLQIQPVLEKA